MSFFSSSCYSPFDYLLLHSLWCGTKTPEPCHVISRPLPISSNHLKPHSSIHHALQDTCKNAYPDRRKEHRLEYRYTRSYFAPYLQTGGWCVVASAASSLNHLHGTSRPRLTLCNVAVSVMPIPGICASGYRMNMSSILRSSAPPHFPEPWCIRVDAQCRCLQDWLCRRDTGSAIASYRFCRLAYILSQRPQLGWLDRDQE